jgi:uncharacterized protein (TIGR02145 family)
LITLSPLRAKAGDVNGNNITQSSDALLINRRITGVISAFSVGNFVNNLPSVSASGNPLMANLRVLSTGDVNGTYNPLPLAPALVLDTVYSTFPTGTAIVRFTTSGSGIYERGVCWGTSPNPTISVNKSVAGTGGFDFTHSFGGLTGETQYYVRAYARNSAGTYYSNERGFTYQTWNRCPGTPSVTDIDGNVYSTVQIGNQCWTQSNLKVSKYRNGDNILTGLSNSAWQNTTSGAYAIYNNDPVNDGLYGKLYNHYAVTDNRGLCPTGWHVPTDAEWTTLENQLGGQGGALKSTATQPTPGGWNPPNTGATNSSGFTALPGGLRLNDGNFYTMPSVGYWWSSSVSNAWSRYLYNNYSTIIRSNDNRAYGLSVRCLKNTLPQVNTVSVTNVTPSTALVTGEVTSEGDQNTTRGFCYSTTSNPTVSNDTTMNGTGLGVYSGTLQNLTPSTTYYVRAYATNSLGTSYGNELSFTTDSTSNCLFNPGTPNPWPASSAPSGGYIPLGNFGAQSRFSISMWVRPESNSGIRIIIDANHGGSSNWVIQTVNSGATWCWGNLCFSLQPSVWQHLLLTYDNGLRNCFINGILSHSLNNPINYRGSPSLFLGNWPEGGRRFNGYIDELYITRDVLATSNFTPEQYITNPSSNTFRLFHFDEGMSTGTVDAITNVVYPLNNWIWSTRP